MLVDSQDAGGFMKEILWHDLIKEMVNCEVKRWNMHAIND